MWELFFILFIVVYWFSLKWLTELILKLLWGLVNDKKVSNR